jgi:hypothetical protein
MYRSMGRETLLDSMDNVSEPSLEAALAYHERSTPKRLKPPRRRTRCRWNTGMSSIPRPSRLLPGSLRATDPGLPLCASSWISTSPESAWGARSLRGRTRRPRRRLRKRYFRRHGRRAST